MLYTVYHVMLFIVWYCHANVFRPSFYNVEATLGSLLQK